MLGIWRLVNTLLLVGATFLLTFSTPFGGQSQVQASPRPEPYPMPYPRFNSRHQKKYIWTPDIHSYPCPSGKTRGHDGDCYRIFQSHSTRNRRSPAVILLPLNSPCPSGQVRGHDGDCYRMYPIRSSSTQKISEPSVLLAKLLA